MGARLRLIRRGTGWLYCAVTIGAALILLYGDRWLPGRSLSPKLFLLGSVAAALSALVLPGLVGRNHAWTAIIVAIVLQVDLGTAYRVPFSRAPQTLLQTTSPGQRGSACVLPPLQVPDIEEPLARLEYATAVAEIQTRVGQEQGLFYLKFFLVAAVLLALLWMLIDSGKEGKGAENHPFLREIALMEEARALRKNGAGTRSQAEVKTTEPPASALEERPSQRTAVPREVTGEDAQSILSKVRTYIHLLFVNGYFWIAVLASAVIDTRLRFNSKMMETLGCWIGILESETQKLYWETYLRQKDVFFEPPTYAVLRAFPSLLTILIFAGTVYVTIIQRGHFSSTISRACASGAILVFSCLAISYHGESPYWMAHCILWTSLGVALLMRKHHVLG